MLKINSKVLCQDLIKHNIVFRKSLICQMPILKDNLYKFFIRGYFDGDGCITHSTRTPKFVITGGEDMLLSIKNKLPCKTYLYRIKHSKAIELSVAKTESVIELYNYLYKDANIFLERKKKKYCEIINCPPCE